MSDERFNPVVEVLTLRLDSLDSEVEAELQTARMHQGYVSRSLDKIKQIENIKRKLSDAIEREKKVAQ